MAEHRNDKNRPVTRSNKWKNESGVIMEDNTLNIPSGVRAQALKTMNEDSRENLARTRFFPEKIDIFNASHTSLEALNEFV